MQRADVTDAGRLFQMFQMREPATAKEQSPMAVLDRGTNRRPELVDRSHITVLAEDGGRM
jgi:hypothetical protein